MKVNPTKQKVVDAASSLFYQKGFHGTSVRDIAEHATVNVSLISYYFNGKQGLLEYAVTNYYEIYLQLLEDELKRNANRSQIEQFKIMIRTIIQYKTENFQIASFINRELSLDSTFVREMTVTYLAKENHILKELFNESLSKQNKKRSSHLFMQLKGMLMSPYILKNEWNNQFVDRLAMESFVKNYTETVNEWVDFISE